MQRCTKEDTYLNGNVIRSQSIASRQRCNGVKCNDDLMMNDVPVSTGRRQDYAIIALTFLKHLLCVVRASVLP